MTLNWAVLNLLWKTEEYSSVKVSLRKFHKQTQKNHRNSYGKSNTVLLENGAFGPSGSLNWDGTFKSAEK